MNSLHFFLGSFSSYAVEYSDIIAPSKYQVASLIFKKILRIQSVLIITKMILKEKPDLDQSTQLQIFVYAKVKSIVEILQASSSKYVQSIEILLHDS